MWERERATRGVQFCLRAVLIIFKTPAKRGRACCNSIASRQNDGMHAFQSKTKSTDGANLKNLEEIALHGPAVVHWRAWYEASRRQSCNSEVVSVSTLGRLQEVQVVTVPCKNHLLEPSEDKGQQRKPHARQPCLTSLTLKCPRVAPANERA